MKVYELIAALTKYPAGKDVLISKGEVTLVPYETDDNDPGDVTAPILIFAKKDT